MSRRGDHMHKRKDGRWEGRYKYIGDDGRSSYRSVYGKTYRECKEKLDAERIPSINCNKKSKRPIFSEILYNWMSSNSIRLKGATTNKYRYMIKNHIVPILGQKSIDQISGELINAFLNDKLNCGSIQRGNKLSPSYVRTMAVIIEAALRHAATEGICPPLKAKICKPVLLKKEPVLIDDKTEQCFTSMLYSPYSDTALGALVALHTGMRLGEVCALQWDDIDFLQSVIEVRHTISRVASDSSGTATKLVMDSPKTFASRRQIPISSVLLPILRQAYSSRCSIYVISKGDHFVSTRTFDYRYRKMLTQCGLAVIHFHAIRHTFATRCIQAGMDYKSLSEILGHSSVNTSLNIYVHPSMENKRSQLEKLYGSP